MHDTAAQHWADRVAEAVTAAGRPPVISTGISPSGEIHIGNMREVLTADAVYRALLDRGVEVGFNYVADNFDPLRKVYPFLDEARYAPLVGQPLSDIPCPCGDHGSYADHFLEPFLSALETLHIDVEVVRADRLYKSGRMNRWIVRALEGRDAIAAILREMTGKPVQDGWSPFNPWCPHCRVMGRAEVLGFSAADETVDFRCTCGARETLPMAGGGKLVWRIDWPARWCELDVTVEPFGKDHATRGGSYDTGKAVVETVFGGEAPHPVPYEWIRLKGQGDMSSSRGNVLSIGDMLEVVPPEVLRYLVIRARPQKTIAFDPGLPLLKLVDEFESADADGEDRRSIELSRAAGFEPVGVPFKHLVVVAQIAGYDVERMREILLRTGYPDPGRTALEARSGHVRRWLDRFAPEDLKFDVREALPAETADLSPAQRRFLGRFADRLEPSMDGDAVHAVLYEEAKADEAMKPKDGFQAVYLALLGLPRGPRAGGFVASVGVEWCAGRFREAAGDQG